MDAKQDRVNSMYAHDLIDKREAFVAANAKELPNGVYGLVMLSVKGNVLSIHELDMSSNIGACIYAIPLSEAENVKTSNMPLLAPALKFTYNGKRFAFDSYFSKHFNSVVMEEAAKR